MFKFTLSIKFSNWPWQRCDEHWSHLNKTPKRNGWGLVPGMARFGGGWDFELGVSYSVPTLIDRRAKHWCEPSVADWIKRDEGAPRSYWASTLIVNLIWGSIHINSKRFFGLTLTESDLNQNRLVCSGRCCELFESEVPQ